MSLFSFYHRIIFLSSRKSHESQQQPELTTINNPSNFLNPSSNLHTRKNTPNRVIINISGQIYETFERTLHRFPNSLLGNREKREKFAVPSTSHQSCYFFNRHRASFDGILFFYQSSGNLLPPGNVDVEIFIEECEYFQLPDSAVENLKKKTISRFAPPKSDPPGARSVDAGGGLLPKLWDIFENRENPSDFGRFMRKLTVFMLTLSITTHCLETSRTITRFTGTHVWTHIYLIINAWFALELLLRFVSSPAKVGLNE